MLCRKQCGSGSAGFRSQLIWIYTVLNSLCLVFVHYLFFNMGQVKLSMDKYLAAIYLSLGKYKLLLFPHPWTPYLDLSYTVNRGGKERLGTYSFSFS